MNCMINGGVRIGHHICIKPGIEKLADQMLWLKVIGKKIDSKKVICIERALTMVDAMEDAILILLLLWRKRYGAKMVR